MRRYECDVLVVGGGGAGLMAAHQAAKDNLRVAVVNKGKVQRTGVTIMAPGAIAAVGDSWKEPGDSRALHGRDTVEGGAFLNNQAMVQVMIETAPELVLELEAMGALFQRQEDGTRYMLRIDGGHSFPRCPFVEDRTGKEMVKAMVSALRKQNVDFYEDIMVTRILKEDGVVTGVAGIHMITLEPVLIGCTAVILATGGAGSIYENTDNAIDMTGDGYAMALEAGAGLRDMEFVQFYPIGLLYPPALKGMLGGLCYYCRLYNAKGERFMERYDPERLELSTRDLVSRAIMQEVQEGRGTPRGGVYMDMTFNEPGFIAKMTPALFATYQNIGIDIEKEMIEIAPTVHFFMGGIDVDEGWRTSVEGLFAAGEICGGMHGGNRLSQNALAEILVSGHQAGRSAGAYATTHPGRPLNPQEGEVERQLVEDILSGVDGSEPAQLRDKLKSIMWDKVGVSRSATPMEEALAEIEGLKRSPITLADRSNYCNQSLLEAIQLKNMLTTATCVAASALARQESRGAHYRSDYPQQDNENFLKNTIATQQGEGIFVAFRGVKQSHYRLGGD